MTLAEIIAEADRYHPCRTIIWTGGEPTLQLTGEVMAHFKTFYNCIETNGTNPVPEGVDYIACSPKVSVMQLRRNFKRVNEIRYPVKNGDHLPDIGLLPQADSYYVSPVHLSRENIDYCVNFVGKNPAWRLSVQIHKLIGIP
jgi:organic radical activating enzyme